MVTKNNPAPYGVAWQAKYNDGKSEPVEDNRVRTPAPDAAPAGEPLRDALAGLLEIEEARLGTGAFKPNAEGLKRIEAARAALAATACEPAAPDDCDPTGVERAVREETEAEAAGIFSPFNACMFRDKCRAQARAAAAPAGEPLAERTSSDDPRRRVRPDVDAVFRKLVIAQRVGPEAIELVIAEAIDGSMSVERERCARKCEGLGWGNDARVNPMAGTTCAAAIRALTPER